MLAKRFTDANGTLYCFNKRVPKKGIFPITPINLFVQSHLHPIENEDGTRNVILEEYFAFLEGKANPIIAKIVAAARGGCKPGLTVEEKQLWDRFVYYQWKRVPDVHEKYLEDDELERVLQELFADFESKYRPITSEEKRKFEDPAWRRQIKQTIRVAMLASGPTPEITEILYRKGLYIGVIRKPNKSFLLGSLPVIRLSSSDRMHLADPTVEFWLPIAHDVVVSPAPIPPSSDQIIYLKDTQVRQLNEAIFRQSTIVAGRSPVLIASLMRSASFP